MNQKIKAALIGVPTNLGAENQGVEAGPDAIRRQGLVEKLSIAGIEIEDLGNVAPRPRTELSVGNARARYLAEIARVSNASAELVAKAIKSGRKPIGLGGDHSVSLGFISGASAAVKGSIGLIYLDAHGDINTPATTPTGNIHGMHLAALLGLGDPELVNVYGEGQKLKADNLIFIGGSDFDQPELDLVERENIKSYPLLNIMSYGLAPALDAIDALCKQVDNVWVSFDLDCVDKQYAPAAAMPNKGGLAYREIIALAEYIGWHQNVIGVDVVEYNPANDIEAKTAELTVEVIARFLGRKYDWYENYLAENKI